MTTTTRAAFRAWATRRANAEARSEAAQKAWATRRANEIAAEYRRRALLAWETRRA